MVDRLLQFVPNDIQIEPVLDSLGRITPFRSPRNMYCFYFALNYPQAHAQRPPEAFAHFAGLEMDRLVDRFRAIVAQTN